MLAALFVVLLFTGCEAETPAVPVVSDAALCVSGLPLHELGRLANDGHPRDLRCMSGTALDQVADAFASASEVSVFRVTSIARVPTVSGGWLHTLERTRVLRGRGDVDLVLLGGSGAHFGPGLAVGRSVLVAVDPYATPTTAYAHLQSTPLGPPWRPGDSPRSYSVEVQGIAVGVLADSDVARRRVGLP